MHELLAGASDHGSERRNETIKNETIKTVIVASAYRSKLGPARTGGNAPQSSRRTGTSAADATGSGRRV